MTDLTTATTSQSVLTTSSDGPATSLWRPGLAAGVTAAVATTAIAGIASAALDVSFESAPGEAIPLLGFAQLTLVFTVVGILLARGIARRAARPRATFTRTTVALTALSLVPDAAMSFDAASKVTLMVTHLAAAAIVIPALAARLAPTD